MTAGGVPFVKGHGTRNDFVLLPDLDDTAPPTPSQVRALCDRRAGLGADGVIRIAASRTPGAAYFMDYRNADGSTAQMCGNGARLFARYLVDAGLEQPGSFTFATRGGLRTAQLGVEGDVSIGMGPVLVGGPSTAVVAGRGLDGIAVDVGNPHLVCLLDGTAGPDLAALDLSTAPSFDHAVFPEGVNIEFVVPLSADALRMRVFERGVGETMSCGTGTVAAAAAHLAVRGRSDGAGSGAPRRIRVEVPGGAVVVDLSGDEAVLIGPAVVVSSGYIDARFWSAHR